MADGLFYVLKPICVIVAKEPTVKHLTAAKATFGSLNQDVISEPALLEYLMFPFNLSLNKKLKEKEEILCFECLTEVYCKCKQSVITEDILLWNLNKFSIFFLKTTKNIDKLDSIEYTTCEEQRLGITVMLRMLLSKVSLSLLNIFYSKERLPLLGHVVSVLLHLVEGEKNLALQLVALECLQLLSGVTNQQNVYSEQIGDTFASFFPGVATSFNKVLVSSSHQNHQLVEACLKTFSVFIKIVLHDKVFVKEGNYEISLMSICNKSTGCKKIEVSEGYIDKENKTLKIERTEKWLLQSANNMKLIFQNIFPILMCHPHVNVRSALVLFLEGLLLFCMNNLKESVPDFIVVLAKLSCDDYETVRNQSNHILKTAQLHFQQNGRRDLQDILDERWYSEIISLPRVISSASNDELKIAKLLLIKGYLQFYGDGLKYLLCTTSYLDKFLNALVQVLELDYTSINVVQEHISHSYISIDAPSSTLAPSYFQTKTFRHYNNPVIMKHIEDVIKLLATHGDLYLLIDHLLENYVNSTIWRIQAVLIMNAVISSKENDKHIDELNPLINLLISTYIQEDWWNLPINYSSFISPNINKQLQIKSNFSVHSDVIEATNKQDQISCNSVSFETLHQNIQLICVLLEGLSTFAKVMKTGFNLIDVLYPILEKVGSANAAINRTAVQTLTEIVKQCGYKSISDLILINSDYLISSITLRFRHYTRNSAAAAVLCVILKYSNNDAISLVADATEDVFRILDFYQEQVAYEMLNVLMHLSQAVDKWFNREPMERTHGAEERKKTDKSGELLNIMNDNVSVKDFFTAYSDEYLHAHGYINESEIDSNIDDEPSFEEPVDVKKEVPLHYRVVKTSLEKCVYYIAARDSNVKLKALDVTQFGVLALRNRENDLLPLLHNLWPAVIKRLKDPDNVVVLKALDVVCIMVEHSGDFLRKRLTDEFLPFVVRFLDEHAHTFTKDQSKFSQVNKVLVKLVRFVGTVVPKLNVSKKFFCTLASSLFLYLDCRLHQAVQEETVSTLKRFYIFKPDIIWLLCQITYKTVDVSCPHDSLNTITLPPSALQRSLCSDNVSKILL